MRFKSAFRLLIKAEDVSGGVAEAGGDLGGIGADGLDDLAARGHDCIARVGNAVAHDVDQESRLRGSRTTGNPCAADLAHAIVKGLAPVSTTPNIPTEDSLVKLD